jgi:hypothetical protein
LHLLYLPGNYHPHSQQGFDQLFSWETYPSVESASALILEPNFTALLKIYRRKEWCPFHSIKLSSMEIILARFQFLEQFVLKALKIRLIFHIVPDSTSVIFLLEMKS